MLKKLITPRRALMAGGLIFLLLAVAFSWRTDNRLHVYVLNVDGHPALIQTPGGKQILIGGSGSPSNLLSTLGKLLPFWDRDLDLVIVPEASSDQLNGLAAVLDRYAVTQIMATDVTAAGRAAQAWEELLAQKGKEPLELQSAAVEPNVNLAFDGSSVLIESGDQRIALGASEHAQINIVDGKIDRLPDNPQLIFMWSPIVSDTRVIDLSQRGTLDLTFEGGGVALGEVR